jgi:hypothetical protein
MGWFPFLVLITKNNAACVPPAIRNQYYYITTAYAYTAPPSFLVFSRFENCRFNLVITKILARILAIAGAYAAPHHKPFNLLKKN